MGLRFPARAHRIPISGLRASVLPPKIAKAQSAFEEDMAVLVRATFDDVAGKVSSGAPDVQQSAEALRQATRNHYEQSGVPIPLPLADMITLGQNLATIAAPLYADIHTTFTNPQHVLMHYPQTRLRAA